MWPSAPQICTCRLCLGGMQLLIHKTIPLLINIIMGTLHTYTCAIHVHVQYMAANTCTRSTMRAPATPAQPQIAIDSPA